MKKAYTAPSTEVCSITLTGLLANSPISAKISDEEYDGEAGVKTTTSSKNIWDDYGWDK